MSVINKTMANIKNPKKYNDNLYATFERANILNAMNGNIDYSCWGESELIQQCYKLGSELKRLDTEKKYHKQTIANLINAINFNVENGLIKFQYIAEEVSDVMELIANK